MRWCRFGALVAVLAVAGCTAGDPPPVSFPGLTRAAYTGKAIIEMVITTGPGATIKGENPDGSAAVDTVSWGVENPASTVNGATQRTRASYDSVTVTRDADAATPGLLSAVAQGHSQQSVVFYIRPAAGTYSADATTWPLRLTLTPAEVTSVQETSTVAGPPAKEKVIFATGKAQFQYQRPGAPPQSFSWNTVTNTTQ